MEKIDTVCIVDDDNTFQFITELIIRETNMVNRIQTFSTGQEAIEYLRSVQDQPEELPEVILLDLNMPVLDGWGFLEEYIALKPRLGKKITIYIVSSSIDPADIEKALAIREVSDFIVKPVTREKMREMLENL